jgi:hypothetical protein
MTKSVADKAEIALEYPDKLYVGTFEHSSRFEAHLDPTGLALILERPGAEDVRKSIHMHINFGLFASILSELASTQLAVFQRTTFCIAISSRRRLLNCTGH